MSSVVANPTTSQSSTSAATSVAIANSTTSPSTTITGPVATMAIIGPNNNCNFTTTPNAACSNPVTSTPNVPSNIPTGGFNSTTAINAASSAVATPEGEGQPSNTRFKVVKIDQRPGGKSATKGAEDGLVHEHRLMSNGQKSITYKRGRWTVTDFYDAPPVIPAVTHLSNPPSNSNSTPSTPTPNSFLTTGPRLINVTNVITGDTSIVHTGGITTPAALDSNIAAAVIHSPPVLMDFNSNNGHPLAGFAVKPVPVKNHARVVQQQAADCTIDSGSGNPVATSGPAVPANESHYSHHHHQHHHHPRHHGDRKENAENEPPSQSENAGAIISGANANVPPCPNSTSKAVSNVTSLCNNGNSGNNNNSHASHAISDHGNATSRTTALASNSQIPLPEESRSKSSNSSNSSSSPSDSDLTTLVTVVGKPHPSKSPKEGEVTGSGPGGGGGGGAVVRPHAVKDDATVIPSTGALEENTSSATPGQAVSAEKPPLPQRTGQFYVSPVAEPIINPNPGGAVPPSSSVAAPDPASGYATPASSIHSVAGTCPQSVQSGIPSAYVVTSVAIDNKIEQAMDLVKSHLMFAVKEEVDVLKEKIVGLLERIQVLETENAILRQAQQQQQLHQQLQQQQQSQLHSQSLLSNINMHPSCGAVAGAQQSSLPTSMIGQANVTDLASAAASSSCASDSCASESLTSIPQSNVPSGSSPGTNLANASTNCATAPHTHSIQQAGAQAAAALVANASTAASQATTVTATPAAAPGPAPVPDEPYKK